MSTWVRNSAPARMEGLGQWVRAGESGGGETFTHLTLRVSSVKWGCNRD